MRESNDTTPRSTARPFAAIVAALLAVAMALMAFDANTLRKAFADEGDMPAAVQPAGDAQGDQEDDGDDGDQSATVGGEGQPVEQEGALADDGDGHVEEADGGGASARDGPAETGDRQGSATEGESVAVTEGSEQRDHETSLTEAQAGQDVDADESGQDAAKVASCYVTFYSDADGSASILARKHASAREGQMATVEVGDVLAEAPTAAQMFEGWLHDGQVYRDRIAIDPSGGDVSLYPSFLSGHWLRFVSGTPDADAGYVPSQFVAGDAGEIDSLPVPGRAGYAFEGWYAGSMSGGAVTYGDQVTDGDGDVLNPQALRHDVGQADVVLYAKWVGVQTEYRVITWHENPDDEGYTYQGCYTVGDDEGESAISGEKTDVAQTEEHAGFTIRSFEQEEIAGDGSTVVNLYYDRIQYSVVFHQERSSQSALFDDLTITAKYGADIHDEWPKASEGDGAYTSAWYTTPDPASSVFVTGIGTMPLGGASYYPMDETGNAYNLVFRVQSLNDPDAFDEYVSQPFSTPGTTTTTADDYKAIKGFAVNAASDEDAQAIHGNDAGDKAATHDPGFLTSAPIGASFNSAPVVTDDGDVPRRTLYVYYLRCQYDVVFEENGGPETSDVEGVYYEASLAGAAPESYVAGETTYEAADGETYTFQGWFDNEALQGEPFDFGNAEMPAGNVVLYASWEPTRHLVQVDPAGGVFTNPAQSTYFYVDHGQPVGAIQVERNYVADDDGGYVYNLQSAATDPDADGFGAAEYVAAGEGEAGERYSWSPGVYSLYGWYVGGMQTLADEPFDFGTPVTEDTSIVARWRSGGVFDIAYDPAVMVDGDLVTGDVDTVRDGGYADLSPTFVVNTPTSIGSESGADYEFVGWQVVEGFDEGAEALADELYHEGDGFVVDSELARENTIHLQAVYERVEDAPSDSGASADTAEPGDADGTADSPDPSAPAATLPAPAQVPMSAASDSGLFPATGDMAQALALSIGAIGLLSLAIALFGYLLRRGVASIHIDQHDPNEG